MVKTNFNFLFLVLAAHVGFLAALPPRPSVLLERRAVSGEIAAKAGETTPKRVQRPFAKVAKESLRKDLLEQCTERWRNATLDHFSTIPPAGDLATFPQRYFVCSNYWKQRGPDGSIGPIFFYLGNEADVTLYLNNTGLMWESAPDFGAMIVFAEHRYYGESVPYGKDVRKHMGYLIAEQAMSDYAELIMELKEEYDAQDSAVIGFGGSYGGMLAAWMRLKYPHVLDGAISASAPIWNFLGETPAFDSGAFAKGVTYDTTDVAGSAAACTDNVRHTWQLLDKYGNDDQGRSFLAAGLQLCPYVSLRSRNDVLYVREWLGGAWDYMAMGNYPYPSSYITNGHGLLPAFPVRVACSYLDQRSFSDQQLLTAMSQAVGVFYNHTADQPCFNPFAGSDPDSDHDADFWDFQWCAEMLMPFSKDGVSDMFWPEPFELEAAIAACEDHWGVTPRPLRATVEWGGRSISAGSNIVFSNGLLDPWHGGGVLADVSDSMPAVIIPEGAHHLDLMFSHPDDPMSVIEVRKFQRESIQDWIQEATDHQPQQQQGIHALDSESATLGRKQLLRPTGGADAKDEEGQPQRQPQQAGMRCMWGTVRQWFVGVVEWFHGGTAAHGVGVGVGEGEGEASQATAGVGSRGWAT